MFIVVQADNVSYDIEVSKPFNTRKEAEDHLQYIYNDLLSGYDKDELNEETTKCSKKKFVVSTVGDELYYGCVKEVKEAK